MTFEKIIKEYLEGRAKSDAIFAEKFFERCAKEEKAIEGCCSYIKSMAKKEAQGGCAVIEDDKVFGWAMHYFDENIAAPTNAPAAKVAAGPITEMAAKMKAEKAVSAPVAKPKGKVVDELQLSLF